MSDLLFSIITVCFNSERTIRRTIESLLHQSYNNFEYIIIDGQSTDATMSIVREYENNFGTIKIVSEKDDGIYDAMNKGIRLAQGKIVGILNSDDFYEEDALEQVARVYTEEKYQILYGMQRNVLIDGRIKSVEFRHHDFLKECMICHPASFVTKAVYDDFGLYDLSYRYSSDYDFMLRMSKDNAVVFKPIYKILSNFTVGGESSKAEAHMETFKIWRKYGCISTKRYILICFSTWVKKIIK